MVALQVLLEVKELPVTRYVNVTLLYLRSFFQLIYINQHTACLTPLCLLPVIADYKTHISKRALTINYTRSRINSKIHSRNTLCERKSLYIATVTYIAVCSNKNCISFMYYSSGDLSNESRYINY